MYDIILGFITVIFILILRMLSPPYQRNKSGGGGRSRSRNKILYHGSSKQLTVLDPRPSHVINNEKAVFATSSYLDAVIFSARWTDYTFMHGYINDRVHLIEMFPGAFDRLNTTGYIHHLPSTTFIRDNRTGLGNEFISRESVKVLKYDKVNVKEYVAGRSDITLLSNQQYFDKLKNNKYVNLVSPKHLHKVKAVYILTDRYFTNEVPPGAIFYDGLTIKELNNKLSSADSVILAGDIVSYPYQLYDLFKGSPLHDRVTVIPHDDNFKGNEKCSKFEHDQYIKTRYEIINYVIKNEKPESNLSITGSHDNVMIAKNGTNISYCSIYDINGVCKRDCYDPAGVYNTATRTYMGSFGKPIFALAILILQSNGKLHVDDLVSKWVKFDDPRSAKMTVAQLLSHSAGLKHDSDTDFEQYQYGTTDFTIEEIIESYKREPLAYEPGNPTKTSRDYSNMGYNVIGYIIEKVSGEPWYEYLQKAIFDPCDMLDTGHGYIAGNLVMEKGAPVEKVGNYKYALALYSTAEDLYKFYQKFDSLIPPDYLKYILEKQSDAKGMRNSFGWYIEDNSNGFQIRKFGGFTGCTSGVYIYYNRAGEKIGCFIFLSNILGLTWKDYYYDVVKQTLITYQT